MRIGLIAISGVRIRTPELVELGVTLPGFVSRGKVIASLPSLGLLTVAGMTDPRHEVTYLEVDDLAEVEELPDFDLVGISSFTAKIDEAYALARRYRARGTPVVLGGLHVTMLPDEAQRHADAIVVGSAEGAWPKLLEDAENGRLQSRYQGASAGVFESPQYAVPRFGLLAGRAYNRFTVQTSRGCPRRCNFCAASLRLVPGFEQKGVEHVMGEIRQARRLFDTPFLELADDNTFLNKRWGKAFLRALSKEPIPFFTETDATVADDLELCDLLAASGCKQLLIGFESPVAADMADIDPRGFKRRYADQVTRVVNTLQSRGISVNGCFILGLDRHTPDVFPRLLELVRSSGLAEVQYTVLTPFPGTPLYEKLHAERRLLTEQFWGRCTLFDVNFVPRQMSVDDLEQGLRWLFAETYTDAEKHRRLSRFRRQRRAARAKHSPAKLPTDF